MRPSNDNSKLVYKVYISDYTYPLVTIDMAVAWDMIRTAIDAGKDVRWVRMTIDKYQEQLNNERLPA